MERRPKNLIRGKCGTETKELNQWQFGGAKGVNQWQFGEEPKKSIRGRGSRPKKLIGGKWIVRPK